MTSQFTPIPASAAETIARYSIEPQHIDIEIAQAAHRLQLVNFWQIAPGSRVLEIGCGQGNCTAVLASAVGPTGHVDAVDPGPPDYGAPFTLAQAQAHLSRSEVGSRIRWHTADPSGFLDRTEGATWDYVVFAHCIWYFATQETLVDLLRKLKGRAKRLLIAEYALKASNPRAIPHVLASTTRAALEVHNEVSEANIRCLSSPAAIFRLSNDQGWALEGETTIVPGEGLLDGHWETGMVASANFLDEVDVIVPEENAKVLLRSMRDAVLGAKEALGGERVATMDVWVAKFTEG